MRSLFRTTLILLYGAFPMACYLVGAVIFYRYFNLDEAAHAEIRRRLDDRKS